MSDLLFVTWDGAGNLMPTLGVAHRLADAGHRVRLLGHPSIHARYGNGGWKFVPFGSAPPYDSTRAGEPDDDMRFLMQHIFAGADLAHDVEGEYNRAPADAVIVDALLLSALSVAEALPAPTVALVHTPYCLFRRGPLVELLSTAMPAIDATRRDLGLDTADSVPQLLDRCDRVLVASPREFDAPGDVPDNVRFVGPILDVPAGAVDDRWQAADTVDPLVLVSFSTSDMRQTTVLQHVIDALAQLPIRVLVTTGPAVDPSALRPGDNTQIARWIDHRAVLPKVSVVVTHGGLGTVMNALGHGIPVVCMPMGRDQFFNATRVAE